MSDYEDASPDAMKAYASIGLTESLEDIRKNDALLQKWTAYKTTTIDDFARFGTESSHDNCHFY